MAGTGVDRWNRAGAIVVTRVDLDQ